MVEDRWAKMQSGVLIIQSGVRMWLAKKQYRSLREAAVMLQSSWRARGDRVVFGKVLRERRAAVAIQSRYRGYKARAEYQKVVGGVCLRQHSWWWGSGGGCYGDRRRRAGVGERVAAKASSIVNGRGTAKQTRGMFIASDVWVLPC